MLGLSYPHCRYFTTSLVVFPKGLYFTCTKHSISMFDKLSFLALYPCVEHAEHLGLHAEPYAMISSRLSCRSSIKLITAALYLFLPPIIPVSNSQHYRYLKNVRCRFATDAVFDLISLSHIQICTVCYT